MNTDKILRYLSDYRVSVVNELQEIFEVKMHMLKHGLQESYENAHSQWVKSYNDLMLLEEIKDGINAILAGVKLPSTIGKIVVVEITKSMAFPNNSGVNLSSIVYDKKKPLARFEFESEFAFEGFKSWLETSGVDYSVIEIPF